MAGALGTPFRLLWTSQALSTVGTEVTAIALPLVVLAATGSAADAGLVATIAAIAELSARLPCGLVADLVDRKRLMVACDLIRASVLVGLAVLVLNHRASLPVFACAAVVVAVLGLLFGPAELGMLRRVVPAPARHRAISLNAVRTNLAVAIGPGLGGVLVGLGAAAAFMFDAGTFLVSALLVSRLRHNGAVDAEQPGGRPRFNLLAELAAGLRWLLRRPALLLVLLFVAYLNLLGRAVELLATVGASDFGAHAGAAGVAMAAAGAGGVAGGLASSRALERLRPSTIIAGTAATWLVLTPLVGAGSLPLVCAAMFGLVFTLPAVCSLVLVTVSVAAPDRLQGRASTAAALLASCLAWLGPAGTGYLVDAFGLASAGTILAVPVAVPVAVLALRARMRARLDRLAAPGWRPADQVAAAGGASSPPAQPRTPVPGLVRKQ